MIREKWEGNLIIVVPPPEGGIVEALRGGPWDKKSKYELAVIFEKDNQLPLGIEAHIIRKPSFRMGQKVTETLINRILGYRGETTYEIVHQRIHFIGEEETA